MEILKIIRNDIPEIRQLRPEGWGDIGPGFQFYLDHEFCQAYKLMVDIQIIAVGSIIFHGHTAWIGHIIVHPAYRRKGYGRIITEHLLEKIDRNYYPTISLVATEMGRGLYRKLGFKDTCGYSFYQHERLELEPAEDAFIRRCNSKDLETVFRMDQKYSGEERRHLFLDQKVGYIYEKGNELEGYYFPQLGEGLIIATNPDAGLRLLRFHIEVSQTIVIPDDNEITADYLQIKGFQSHRKAYRMTSGPELAVEYPSIYSRIGGNMG